jgi:hypothetical protein
VTYRGGKSAGARVRIFKNAWFVRFSRRHGISDSVLREAVERAEMGRIDADLGGGVLKQRIARAGQGKSGGFRTIILYRRSDRAFFVYGFAKSDRANVDRDEVETFRKAARYVLDLSDRQLDALIAKGQFAEIKGDDEEISE